MPDPSRVRYRPSCEGVPSRLRQREIVILSGSPSTPATKIVTEGLRFFVGLPTSLFSAWVSHHKTNSACASNFDRMAHRAAGEAATRRRYEQSNAVLLCFQRGKDVAARLVTTKKGRPKLNASIEAFNQAGSAALLTVSRATVQRAQVLLATKDTAAISIAAAMQMHHPPRKSPMKPRL